MQTNNKSGLEPNSIVKSCKYLEMGCAFLLDGMYPIVLLKRCLLIQ